MYIILNLHKGRKIVFSIIDFTQFMYICNTYINIWNLFFLFADAMAIVRQYGRPTYFLTMTANAKWQEIKDSLYPGENSQDRPDVVSRIFEVKVKELIRDLMKRNVLGRVKAILLMTEWQKRGKFH